MTAANKLPEAEKRLMTPANIVTLIRICLVPVFVLALISPWPQWFGLPETREMDDTKSLIAAGIFILISCTDWLDGYLARSRNEVTDFGKFMDPLADKILVTAALLALIELGLLPSWVVLVILAREFIVSGVRMVAASEGVVIAASWYGKVKTVFQMIAIVLFTVKDSHMVGDVNEAFSDTMWLVSWAVMLIALLLTVISMLDYISKARELLGFGQKKSPRGKENTQSHDKAQELPLSGEASLIEPEALDNLARSVLDAAKENRKSIGTAESLTGGLIAAFLTDIPGSSEVMRGAVVSYATEVKQGLLEVDAGALARVGAVSEQVACEMAQGAAKRLTADVVVSVTGIAGPEGALPNKPVGTVWIGCYSNQTVAAQHFEFKGTRDEVRKQTVRAALDIMLKALHSTH